MARYRPARVLGDRPFAPIGRPDAAVRSEAHGVIVVGGSLGPIRSHPHHRIGVFDLAGLRCRTLVASRWPVRTVALHPELPLAAVGTGRYDGGYAFEGELLLVDLDSGHCTSLLEGHREVRAVRWLDARVLETVLSPYDDYRNEAAHRIGHAVRIDCADWTAVEAGTVTHRRQAGPEVPCARPDGGPAAEALLAELCAAHGTEWALRRRVRAVEALPDGGVLAAMDGVRAECLLPSGEVRWSLPDPDGGQQLVLAADGRSVWVNTPRPAVFGRRAWRDGPGVLERLALDDGRVLVGTATPGPVVLTGGRDGRLAARTAGAWGPQRQVLALAPDDGTPLGPVHLSRDDGTGEWFGVRDSPEPAFILGHPTPGIAGVVAVDPDRMRTRGLFRLDWEQGRRRLAGGPAVHLDEDGAGAGLVHAAEEWHGPAYLVRRRLPDGAPLWVFAGEQRVLAVDADREHVYAGLDDGELVVLDRRDGSVRHRERLTVDGLPVVPLSVAAPGGGRLLVGTADGRILDGRYGEE